MNTLAAARAIRAVSDNPSPILQPAVSAAAFTPARQTAIDLLFRGHALVAKAEEKQDEAETGDEEGRGSQGGAASGGLRFDITKLCVDVTTTGRSSVVEMPKNVSLSTVNLLERIKLGAETLWRNPVRTRISHWGRREVMHVFNGFFAQTSLKEWDRYETFGKCYTAPDPFKNDDPPWKACFCA